MISNRESLSMAESLDYLKKVESENDVLGFIKKFTKMKPEAAKEFRKKFESLSLMKVKSEHISKIIDLVPRTAEELNKIFTDVNLDEDETKKILDIFKEFK